MSVGVGVFVMALALDLLIGDPAWLPHPVRLMGAAIERLEKLLRAAIGDERIAGAALMGTITIGAFFAAWAAYALLQKLPPIVGVPLCVLLASTTIALRGLMDSVREVFLAHDISEARMKLGMIVGRDTAELDEAAVHKAALESLAENLSDGVVAPLFYLALGGLPLVFFYKAVNTLDSMVGYKNDRYIRLGEASAMMDDIMNHVPARLTGWLMAGAAYALAHIRPSAGLTATDAARGASVMLSDGGKHPSPNSGVPEAAMAGVLGVRFGGPATYGGVPSDKPYINPGGSDAYAAAMPKAMLVAGAASAGAAMAGVLIILLRMMQ